MDLEARPSPHIRTFAFACFGLAAGLPWIASNFVIFQLTLVMVYAIAILGLNLLTGLNGQVSLGHSAFFALGAYVCAALIDHEQVPYYLTVPVAGLASFAAGFLFGLPALRLQGSYLALATFALAIATPQLLKFSGFEGVLGGVEGISLSKPDAPAGLPVSSDQWLYYYVLAFVVVACVVSANLGRSRTGRALMAIREHPVAAAAMGVNVALYKATTFGISALFAGAAGALAATVVQFIAPDSYTVLFSIALLVGLVVGGVGSIPGAFIGGLFILYVPNLAEKVSKSLAGGIYALILLAVVYLMPGGLAGAWAQRQRIWRWLTARGRHAAPRKAEERGDQPSGPSGPSGQPLHPQRAAAVAGAAGVIGAEGAGPGGTNGR